MSVRGRQDRVVVALAAVTCGRLSGATSVRAGRGRCAATADQYRVQVTEPGVSPPARRRDAPSPEVVLEHWGGDAELLSRGLPLSGSVGLLSAAERARAAARTVDYYDLDSLQITYPDGAELSAGRTGVVLYGPRRGPLRRRRRLLRAEVSELLSG